MLRTIVSGRALVPAILFLALGSAATAAPKWNPPDPKELAETTPRVERDSGVEVIYRENTIDGTGLSWDSHELYERVKFYTQQGIERLPKIEIPYDPNREEFEMIEARTIAPDGRIREVQKSEFFDVELVRTSDRKTHAKTFAPPGLVPGSILEYRYRITTDGHRLAYAMIFQTEIPTRKVRYRINPAKSSTGQMQMLQLGFKAQNLETDADGYFEFIDEAVPAAAREKFGPPKLNSLRAAILYYSFFHYLSPQEYWQRFCYELHADSKRRTRPTRAIKDLVAKLTDTVPKDEEKLARLHDYCRTKITNLSRKYSGYTKEQRSRLKKNSDAGDTLKHGYGTAEDITELFIAMARAAGFEARFALANDRSILPYRADLAVPFIFDDPIAAVKYGDSWVPYQPSEGFLPAAMAAWRNTETHMIVADSDRALIVPIQANLASRSVHNITAQLALAEDGTLEGEVETTLSGHLAADERAALEGTSAGELGKHLLADLEPHLSGAEITAVQIENGDDSAQPLRVKYHLRVPAFAESTGSRFFVQPSVFHRGGTALFDAQTRRTAIVFPYRYRSVTHVTIKLPESWRIESPAAPPSLEVPPVCSYQVSSSWHPDEHRIEYHREFEHRLLAAPPSSYPQLRRLFEVIHERDNHTLTFRLPPKLEAAQ